MAQAVRDLRRRIKAIRNTQQITRAMQMVAAAKLRKAQARAVSARAYATRLEDMLHRLAQDGMSVEHFLLKARPVRRATLVVITGDRGLAGSYNSNLIRQAEATAARLRSGPEPVGVRLVAVGRKGRDYFQRRGWDLVREEVGVADDDLAGLARDLATSFIDSFSREEADEVLVVYSRFISPLQQKPTELRVLPIAEVVAAGEGEAEGRAPVGGVAPPPGYIYEPDARTVFGLLLPKFVTNQVYQCLLEGRASEYAARMTAMKNATDNAEELVGELTLEMHRARQTSITREVMELVGGANALKDRR